MFTERSLIVEREYIKNAQGFCICVKKSLKTLWKVEKKFGTLMFKHSTRSLQNMWEFCRDYWGFCVNSCLHFEKCIVCKFWKCTSGRDSCIQSHITTWNQVKRAAGGECSRQHLCTKVVLVWEKFLLGREVREKIRFLFVWNLNCYLSWQIIPFKCTYRPPAHHITRNHTYN